MLTCPKCPETFNRVAVFVTHYRHVHTDYAVRIARARGALRGARVSGFQLTQMAKDQARQEIDAEIKDAIKKVMEP